MALPRTEYRNQTPDELVRSRRVGGLLVDEWRHVGNTHHPRCAWPEPTLSLVLSGSFVERLEHQRRGIGTTTDVPVDTLWCRPPGLVHANDVPASGVHVVVVRVGDGASASLREFLGTLDHAGLAVTGPEVRALGRRLHRELCAADDLSGLGIEATVAELAYGVARRVRGGRAAALPAPWLARVHDRLREACRGPIPSLAELAAAEGMHPASFARAFRQAYGVTPAMLMRECRLQWAREALEHHARPLSEIAHEAGFADHSHFTRAFRTRFGMAPRQWREHGNAHLRVPSTPPGGASLRPVLVNARPAAPSAERSTGAQHVLAPGGGR